MKLLRLSIVVSIIGLAAAASAPAQSILSPILNAISAPSQSAGTSAIGPDGTYYVLVPGATTTPSTPVTEMMAVGLGATPKWSANLTGDISSILPGVTNVYAVLSVTSGSGRSFTTTTTIQPFAVATGTQGMAISPSGRIVDVEVRTVGGADYLYVQTVSSTSSSSGGTTTTTTTRTLTIYSQTGSAIKTVSL